jgi:hypothetical protein
MTVTSLNNHGFYHMPVYSTQNSNNYLLTLQQPFQPQPCNNHQQQVTQGCDPQYLSIPFQIPVPQLIQPYVNPGGLPPQNPPMLLPFSLPPGAASMSTPEPFTVPATLPAPPPQVFYRTPSPSPSASPSFGAVSEPVFFSSSTPPSPSLGARSTTSSVQNMPIVQPVEPDISQCELLYELSIIKHQATVQSINNNHAGEIADAMRNVLRTDVWYLFVVVTAQDKNMTIQWVVHPGSCDFQSLLRKTQAKDFEKELVCELAHVGKGDFNKHLHNSKQLTIINEGYSCFARLNHALDSFNGAKERLLDSCFEDKFEEENVRDLFHVCEAPRGCALRGDTVVGGHFRGGDVLKLNQFLDVVEATIGDIQRATMIPSMKGKAQYKGWSIYVQTPSVEHVERIKQTCSTRCNFEKAEIFTAVDKFKKQTRV